MGYLLRWVCHSPTPLLPALPPFCPSADKVGGMQVAKGDKAVVIIEEEFERALPKGWRRGYREKTSENIYDYPMADQWLVRVWSSIWARRTRPLKEDSIKVTVYHVHQDRSFILLPRVYRQKGWKTKLQLRIQEAMEIIKTDRFYHCPMCGHLMTLRTNKQDGSKFWGCSTWNKDDPQSCKGTKPFVGRYVREEI